MDIQSQIDYLFEVARCTPSADNSQPWRLRWNGKTLAAGYDALRVKNVTFAPENPATLLAMGALLENLQQAAAAAEIRLESVDHPADQYFQLNVSSDFPLPAGCMNHPLFLRHTNRLPFRADPLPAVLSDWLASQGEGAARVTVLGGSSEISRVARLVGQASAIRFQTREITEWLGRSLRFTPNEVASGDGLDVGTLHLPPGGKGLLRLIADWRRMESFNRWGAHRLLAAIEAKAVTNASAILAIVSIAGRRGARDAGQLMERVWIELNRQGLSVQPFYVVADQLFRREEGVLPKGLEHRGDLLADEAESVFSLSDRKLYMLLRVGFPKRIPVKSRRLPLPLICES